jgi:integrase
VTANVASMARLRSSRTQRRAAMSANDVRKVIAAAGEIDPAAGLALRLAAIAGARRAELAALRWVDVSDGMLVIDSAIEIVSRGDGRPTLRDASTKTANSRTLTLDPSTLAVVEQLRAEREPYGPWMFGVGEALVNLTGSGTGGRGRAVEPGSTAGGDYTICATGRRRPRWGPATTSAPSPSGWVTRTRR